MVRRAERESVLPSSVRGCVHAAGENRERFNGAVSCCRIGNPRGVGSVRLRVEPSLIWTHGCRDVLCCHVPAEPVATRGGTLGVRVAGTSVVVLCASRPGRLLRRSSAFVSPSDCRCCAGRARTPLEGNGDFFGSSASSGRLDVVQDAARQIADRRVCRRGHRYRRLPGCAERGSGH